MSRHEYEPFGEEWQPVVPPTTARQFTGKERDPETGLDYFGARYSRADLGQFTTVDPALDLKQALVDPQRWNRYAYVTNNPLRYVDPDGRDRMGMYEPGQRGTAAPWRGLRQEVTTIVAVAAGFVAPYFAPELASAAAGCFLSPACQQDALELMAPEGSPAIAGGGRIVSGAYEAAAAGGAHAGALRNMTGRSLGEVEKAVRGYERQVAEHVDKLAHPSRYIKDWETMTSVERTGLLSKMGKGSGTESRPRRCHARTFHTGRLLAFNEALSIMQQEATGFGIAWTDLCIDDLDPDRDLV